MAEVARVGRGGGATPLGRTHRWSASSAVDRRRTRRRSPHMIPPGVSMATRTSATGVAPARLAADGSQRSSTSPLPDGASCTACGAPVPTAGSGLLASRDDLAFVRARLRRLRQRGPRHAPRRPQDADDGQVLDVATDGPRHACIRRRGPRRRPIDGGRRRGASGSTSPPGTGDLVGWLDASDSRPWDRRSTGERALRARERGRDGPDPRLLRRSAGSTSRTPSRSCGTSTATSSRASRRTSTCRTSTSTSR